MKHSAIYRLVIVSLCTAFMAACSDDEEILLPNDTFVDKFDIPAGATGPEAELRREFYARNGCYIIFSDTLSVVRDEFGNLLVETVDFEWNLTTSGSESSEWELCEDLDEKREAAGIIEKYILPHIMDGAMRPHSVLPFRSIVDKYDDQVSFKQSWRCLGLNMSDFAGAAEDEYDEIAMNLLKAVFKSKVSSSDEELDPFHEVSEEYTSEYISDYFPEWEDDQDMDIIYNLGFISYKKSKKPVNDKFLSSSNDYKAYVDLVFDYSPEQVKEMYGRYDKIMTKYEMISKFVENVGIKVRI